MNMKGCVLRRSLFRKSMETTNTPKIRIYTADTTVLHDTALYAKAYAAVSDARRDKTDRLRCDRDKRLSLGAGCLFVRACLDFGADYKSAQIVTDEYGKPGFAELPLYFNLSHSGTRAMCIVAEVPVGCDVEQIRPVKPGLAGRFFSEEENRALEGCETPEAREALFFKLWTLKESFLKCTGRGLRTPLNAFSVSVGPEGAALTQSADEAEYRLFEKAPGDGYQYAWCVRASTQGAQIRENTAQWETVDLQRI